MKGPFPAWVEGIILSRAFTDMDPRRPQTPKELVPDGPRGYPEHTLPLVRDQRPELSPQTASESHPLSSTPDYIMKWDSGVAVTSQKTQRVRSSHS